MQHQKYYLLQHQNKATATSDKKNITTRLLQNQNKATAMRDATSEQKKD
jgi:hypothetical protein